MKQKDPEFSRISAIFLALVRARILPVNETFSWSFYYNNGD